MEINRYLKQAGFTLIGPLIILAFLIITAGGMVALPAVRQVWEKRVSPTPVPKPSSLITPKLSPSSTVLPTTLPIIGKDVTFETIKSWQHQHAARGNYVIQNAGEWQNLWYKMYPSKETGARYALPEVDFTRSMVIAVLSGGKPTGGYSTKIIRIVETTDKLKVHIEETSPGEECIVTMSPTTPRHIVKVTRIEKEVEFISEHKIRHCE